MLLLRNYNVSLGLVCLAVVFTSLPKCHGISSDKNPCLEFSFDKCSLDPSWVISSSYDISDEEECQTSCGLDPRCKFYIYITDSSTCQLINQPEQTYLDTCMELGLSGSHKITECKDSNDPCKGFFDEDCLFLGDLLDWVESVDSPELCQSLCVDECKYSLYSKPDLKCYMLSTGIRRCSQYMGLPSPNINQCIPSPFTSTTLTPITTTSTQKFFKVLIVAGQSQGKRLDDTELFNPYSEENNCAKPMSYPLKIENLCGAGITFCGGYVDGIDFTNHCHEFKDGSWSKSLHLNYGRQSAVCTQLSNGSYWIGGGLDFNSALQSTELRMYENSEFVMSTNLPEPMERSCISTINSTHFFIAGNAAGDGKRAYIVGVEQEDFMVTNLPSMNYERFSGACGSLTTSSGELQLIVAGGANPNSRQTIEIFSYAQNNWRLIGDALPRGFEYGGYISDSQHPLILIGGLDEHAEARDDIMEFKYEDGSPTFEYLPGKMDTRRQYFAATGLYTEDDC